MNILFVSDSYLPATNGIVKQILMIREELHKRGHRVIILAPAWKKDDMPPPEEDVIYVPSIKFFMRPNDRITTGFHPKAEKKLLGMNVDVVHCHQGVLGSLGTKIAKKKNIPQVVTQHTAFQEYVRWLFPFFSKFTKPLTNFLSRKYYKYYDTIIAPSIKAVKVLERARVKPPIKLLHNGIKLNLFKNADPSLFLKKYKISKNEQLLVLVGRIDYGKNVDIAVKSMKEIIKKFPKCKLAIIGDGNERKEIEDLIKEQKLSDNVFVTGFIDYKLVASANNACTFAIMTSDSDTLPTVAIEAIACGKTMVAVHDDAITAIIKDGKNGILTEKNPSAFAESVIELLQNSNLRDQYSQKSFEHSQNFSIEKNVDELEKLYQEMIDKKSKQ